MNQHTDNFQQITPMNQLNAQQLEAVETTDGPLLVLAGAGTGKTKVLTCRIGRILQKGVFPRQILSVTFTNKAAKEMQKRVHDIAGVSATGMWLGTFHSICARILRQHAPLVGLDNDFTIIDTSDQLRLLKQIILNNNIDEKKWPAKQLAWIIGRCKDRGLTPQKVQANDMQTFSHVDQIELYKQYQHQLKILNACDFDDLVLHNLTILMDHPDILEHYHRQFRYILVDEYQDTNVAQYLWLRLLAQGHCNICCVGDDDQSIYGWRGAEVGNILRFEKDYKDAKVIRLEQNYRSTSHILSAASGLIAHNANRLCKHLWTDGADGSLLKLVALWDEQEEARHVAENITSLQSSHHILSEIAILVRASFQTRAFEECFITYGIPYKVIGGLRFYERMEIRDIIAYLRLISVKDNDLALERIINTPKRGIGSSTMQKLRDTGKEKQLSLFKTIQFLIETKQLKPSITKTLATFVENIISWSQMLGKLSPVEFTELILKESGYLAMWQNDKTIEAQGRVENIRELLRALEEFESIAAFLEHVSLITDIDMMDDKNLVNIMTLHAAKGLEFDTVFLPGWEEGLFPHQRSLDEKGSAGLEEERRLAYVGITRAKKQVFITYTANRRVYGQYQSNIPSRFIDELPHENCEVVNLGNGLHISPKATAMTAASSQTTETFQKGQRIFHQKFGYGRIINIDGEKLDIAFEKAGNKKVVQSYVELV